MYHIFSIYTHHLWDYMRRFIFETPLFSIRVHHILKSDDDRWLHDHPFAFASVLLSNGYREVTPERVKDWPRFSIITHKPTDLHRIVANKGDVWTFVVTGPRVRTWGFQTKDGWVPYYELGGEA